MEEVIDIVIAAETESKNADGREAKNGEVNGGAANAIITPSHRPHKIRIQVSKTKKPLIFYLNLAKKYIKQDKDVELCALGMAIPTVVIISEILKCNGWAIEKNIITSTIGAKEDKEGRAIQKAKIEILLGKAGKMDQSTVAETWEEGADNKA